MAKYHKPRYSKDSTKTVERNRTGEFKKLNRKPKKLTVKNVVYKYLADTFIELPYDWDWSEHDHPEQTVPPTTPNSNEYQFEFRFQLMPQILHDLTTLELPLVRKCGIKQAIEELGLYFGCNEYKYNYLQFWFLDVITDCIWKSQDRYEFLPDQQKIILSWLLFMFDIIGDVNYAYTQKECFAIFKESIIAAAEVLEEGSNEILLPLKLIKIRTGQDSVDLEEAPQESVKSETCSMESTSTDISVCSEESKREHSMDYNSVFEIDMGTDKLQLNVDHEMCFCSEYDLEDNSSAHNANASEPEYSEQQNEADWMDFEEEEEVEDVTFGDNWDYRDFYKPCSRTPSRFLNSSSEEVSVISESLEKESNMSLTDFGSLSKLKFLRFPCSTNPCMRIENLQNYIIFRKESSINNETVKSEDKEVIIETHDPHFMTEQKNETDEIHIERIMKGLKKLKLVEQRMRDLSDSKVGLFDWQTKSDEEFIMDPSLSVENCIPEDYMEEHLNVGDINDTELINFSILWAIIDFVYDYFGDSFQFNLVKAALTVKPNVYTQVINDLYLVPKTLAEDLTSKVPDLKDKNKRFTRKIEAIKKDARKKSLDDSKKKKDKKPKSDKKEDSKKRDKSKDKDKNKGKNKNKSSKMESTDKDSKLTKEELLLIQKLEREEAAKLKKLRNKIYMFPLTEAVNDKFFAKKFANWTNPAKLEERNNEEKIVKKVKSPKKKK